MRSFFYVLIFVIAFSGYSTAANAFGGGCCPQEKASCHDLGQDTQKNCHDCCISYMSFTPNFIAAFRLEKQVLNPVPVDHRVDDFISSFLRPPRHSS